MDLWTIFFEILVAARIPILLLAAVTGILIGYGNNQHRPAHSFSHKNKWQLVALETAHWLIAAYAVFGGMLSLFPYFKKYFSTSYSVMLLSVVLAALLVGRLIYDWTRPRVQQSKSSGRAGDRPE